MPAFLVELYMARSDGEAVERAVTGARTAAETLTREGTPVRCVSSIFVPEDETCFLLYEAASADVVRTAAERAEVPFERIAAASVPRKV
jgi:Protein of unknown function (DUF4242)